MLNLLEENLGSFFFSNHWKVPRDLWCYAHCTGTAVFACCVALILDFSNIMLT